MSQQKSTINKRLTNNASRAAEALQAIKYPGDVLTDDMAADWVKVGAGNIVRLVVGATTYVIFSDDNTATLTADVAATPALMLAAGEHYVLCAEDYIKTSANPTRKELLKI